LSDTVFFMKDIEGRYTHVNLTLVRRLGMKERSELLHRTVTQVFPEQFGRSYKAQDDRVLAGGSIEDHLETHFYQNRAPGWCLTIKRPLHSGKQIVGLVGISRDLGMPDSRHSSFNRLQRAIDYMQANFESTLRVQTMADIAEVSLAQLERLFKRVFQLTPQQMLTKMRIEEAMRLLQQTDLSIAQISQSCGYADQSAFARQFKATVSMSPRVYRNMPH
jgi:AraC-like DNA-binding protein